MVWGNNASSERFGVEWKPSEVYLDVKKEGSEVDDMLIRLSTAYPGMSLGARSQFEKATEKERDTVMTVTYGIYAILVLFALFGIFSFYRTSAYKNAGLYGALRACGFSRNLMLKFKLLESCPLQNAIG